MGNHWFPNGSGVSIETQDGATDLSDVTWQRVAPCGCVSGLMVAALPDELTVTADQAMRRFVETEAEYRRDVEQGFTCRPREHRAACDEAKMSCTHDPKWGVEPKPKVEGYTWAAVYALGARPKLTHLVPDAAVQAAKDHDYSVLDVKPLCGGKGAFHWHAEHYATFGKVECKRCLVAAIRVLSEGVR